MKVATISGLFLLGSICVNAQIITTVAGSNSKGDGGPANAATINQPFGMAIDGSGNLYVADTDNNRIRKVATDGTISTVAGNGTAGLSGDGGPAISAQLKSPYGVVVDTGGNLIIADRGNSRVRKVSTAGIITTIAGNGFGGDGGTAATASLANPTGVAVDKNGDIYIADQNNHRVRKIATSGVISTVAGDGTAGYGGDGGVATAARLNYPYAVTVDETGNLYIADRNNNRIRKVSPTGVITTVVGNGNPVFSGDGAAATNAAIAYPTGVALDKNGILYIADNSNQRIRRVSASGIITTVAGNGLTGFGGDGGAATSARLYYPTGVTVDDTGNFFIADNTNNRIRKVSPSGIISTLAGNGTTASASGDGGVSTNANLTYPTGVSLDGKGNLFIADLNNHRIRKVSATGVITTVAGNGSFGFSGDGGAATNASLNSPYGVAVDGNGSIYVADHYNSRIRRITSEGIITTVAGNGSFGFSGDGGVATSASLNYPTGVAVDQSGNIFIADRNNNRIRKVSTTGIITTVTITAALASPSGITLDRNGNLFIADANNHLIRRVSGSGIVTTVAGDGTGDFSGDGGVATNASLNYPTGVAVDQSGNIFIADQYNQRIRKVSSTGIITTVAGKGTPNFSGDGGNATNASLAYPYGVAVDTGGNLFIADQDNNRIRKVSGPAIVSVRSGDWSSADTWSCSCIPSSNDRVIVSVGHTITVSQAIHVLSVKQVGNLVFVDNGKISF